MIVSFLFMISLKRRKCSGGKYNFLERLLGASRLLSQVILSFHFDLNSKTVLLMHSSIWHLFLIPIADC